MELVWTIPAIAAVAGTAVLLVLGRRVGAEVRDLRASLARSAELRTAVNGLRHELDETRTTVRTLRHR